MTETPQLLTIGASGFVGSKVREILAKQGVNVLDLSYPEIDITDPRSTLKALKNTSAKVIINFAAYTNVKEAENQRNNQAGDAWNINVNGAANVAQVCHDLNLFLIHISTDHVFPMFGKQKGFYKEDDPTADNVDDCSWYGFTKLNGEKKILEIIPQAAIVRLSYPFGNSEQPDKDYITKLIKSIQLGYGIFDDQKFTPTYIKILPQVLQEIASRKLPGKYHCVCREATTPFEVATYLVKQLDLPLEVKRGSLEKLQQEKGNVPYSRSGILLSEDTQKKLNLEFPTWKEALDDFIPKLSVAVI